MQAQFERLSDGYGVARVASTNKLALAPELVRAAVALTLLYQALCHLEH